MATLVDTTITGNLTLPVGNTAQQLATGLVTFTGNSTWVCPAGVTSITYLIVAGGGGGGTQVSSTLNAGGGGGGGVLTGTAVVTPGVSYTITVGAGGGTQTNGANSSIAGTGFTTLTAVGGGAGGGTTDNQPGSNGGSGGGGEARGGTGTAGGTAVSGQGTAGGTGSNGGSYVGGGGGGAGGAGINGSISGNGGPGLASYITGVLAYYGAGGGGGGNNGIVGVGGAGGGGKGGSNFTALNPTAGTTNTGGGGGGSGNNFGVGAAGGSGIVIINYTLPTTGAGGMIRYNTTTAKTEYCNSGTWVSFGSVVPGSSSNLPAASPYAIALALGSTPTSGVYWFSNPGYNSGAPFQAYADWSLNNWGMIVICGYLIADYSSVSFTNFGTAATSSSGTPGFRNTYYLPTYTLLSQWSGNTRNRNYIGMTAQTGGTNIATATNQWLLTDTSLTTFRDMFDNAPSVGNYDIPYGIIGTSTGATATRLYYTTSHGNFIYQMTNAGDTVNANLWFETRDGGTDANHTPMVWGAGNGTYAINSGPFLSRWMFLAISPDNT